RVLHSLHVRRSPDKLPKGHQKVTRGQIEPTHDSDRKFDGEFNGEGRRDLRSCFDLENRQKVTKRSPEVKLNQHMILIGNLTGNSMVRGAVTSGHVLTLKIAKRSPKGHQRSNCTNT